MVHVSFYIAARRNLVHGIGPTKGERGWWTTSCW